MDLATPVSSPVNYSLVNTIGDVLIIAHKEPTQALEKALTQEGFKPEVLRQTHQPEFQGFSPSYLCLLNHCRAWKQAAEANTLTLIVEADFVPVVGLGKLPLPCRFNQSDLGIAWLYTCAPQLYSVSQEGYAEGFSTSMVAYIVTPRSAQHLLELAETIRQTIGETQYSTWDSQVDEFLRHRNLRNYIPFRNYGEHGGRPNPEHRKHGLSVAHRADVLYNRLAFMPPYAMMDEKPAYMHYLMVRSHARMKGIARLMTGKFVRLKVLHHSTVAPRLVWFALHRQLFMNLELPGLPNHAKPVTMEDRPMTDKQAIHDSVFSIRG